MIITTAHPLFHWQGLVVQQELHPTLFSFSQQFSLYNEIPTNNIMKTDVPIYKINHIDLSEVALTWKFQKNFFSRSITFSKTITMIFLRLQSRIHYPNILLLIAAIFVTRFHNHISFVIDSLYNLCHAFTYWWHDGKAGKNFSNSLWCRGEYLYPYMAI